MVRHAFVLGFASLAIGARGPGCGGVDSSVAGLNAPCTRDSDCASGLSCQSGVCTGPLEDAAVPDAGPPDDGGLLPDAAPKDAHVDG